MRNSIALALALLAFSLGAVVAGVAAHAGTASGWDAAAMLDFCRRMMGTT